MKDIDSDQREDRDWYLSIKSIREQKGVDILGAAKVMFQNPMWRRWVVFRVRENRQCLREAQSYIDHYGDNAPFILEGKNLVFKDIE